MDLTLTELGLIARAAYDTLRTYNAAVGDPYLAPWDDAPERQRDDAMVGVLFHRENPQDGAAGLHEEWRRLRLAEGWVYGAVKDRAKKTHPFLVPFNELPIDQQAKRHLFRAFVLATAQMIRDHRAPPPFDRRTHIERINP